MVGYSLLASRFFGSTRMQAPGQKNTAHSARATNWVPKARILVLTILTSDLLLVRFVFVENSFLGGGGGARGRAARSAPRGLHLDIPLFPGTASCCTNRGAPCCTNAEKPPPANRASAPAPRQRGKSSVGDLPAPRSRAAPTRKIQRRRSARAAAAPHPSTNSIMSRSDPIHNNGAQLPSDAPGWKISPSIESC